MKKKNKILFSVAIFILVVLGAVFFLNSYLKKEIKKGLKNEYPASVLSYDDISINAFAGNATIKNLKIKKGVFSLQASEVNLSDFSYSDYIEDKDVTIGRVHLMEPIIVIKKSDSTSNGTDSKKEIHEREIRIKYFSASGGNIKMIENDTASNSLFASLKNLQIEEIIIEKKAEGTLLPFSYEAVNVESDSLYYELSDTHFIQAGNLNLENKDLTIDAFSIIPKYSKQVFDQQIPYEQDWIALKVAAVIFNDLEWEKEEEQISYTIKSTSIKNANLEIYRNKLLKDDIRQKSMYSEMLRNLDFKLHMDSVNISNTYIEYQEKVLEGRPPGKLSFHNVQAGIKNITNHNLDSRDFPRTLVEARALFMGETNLTLNWEFDVSNELDQFQVNGMLGSIRAEQINSFLVPAMNVKAEGNIESLHYNFYGNRNVAKGDMQMAYRNFKVNILKDGEDERKSFLSGLANLIIKNDLINDDVEQENISVTRDKTKSFWNFLWLCIREGALSTFF